MFLAFKGSISLLLVSEVDTSSLRDWKSPTFPWLPLIT